MFGALKTVEEKNLYSSFPRKLTNCYCGAQTLNNYVIVDTTEISTDYNGSIAENIFS